LTAATGRCGIRVRDHEAGPFEPLLIIDFRSSQILIAHWVHDQADPFALDDRIIVRHVLIEREAILKARATTTGDEYAQLQSRVALFLDQGLHLTRGTLTELDRGGCEGFDTH